MRDTPFEGYLDAPAHPKLVWREHQAAGSVTNEPHIIDSSSDPWRQRSIPGE